MIVVFVGEKRRLLSLAPGGRDRLADRQLGFVRHEP